MSTPGRSIERIESAGPARGARLLALVGRAGRRDLHAVGPMLLIGLVWIVTRRRLADAASG
jgi:hypothetical protein